MREERTSFSPSSAFACDVIGLDLCPSAPVGNERLLVSLLVKPRVYLYFGRAK